MNRVYRVYLVALLWGLVAALIALIVMRGHHALPKDLKSVRDLLTAVLLFFAGRIGKRQGAKAIGVGMATGLIYGVASGWSALFSSTTRAEMLKALHGHALPPAGINVAAANSPLVHGLAWAGTVALALVFGLLLGAIGGATAKAPSASQDV